MTVLNQSYRIYEETEKSKTPVSFSWMDVKMSVLGEGNSGSSRHMVEVQDVFEYLPLL